MSEERCALSDLPAGQCACRKHKPGQVVDAHETTRTIDRSGTPGPVVVARYGGRCRECDELYQPGDEICAVTMPWGTSWVHADHADEIDPDINPNVI